MDKHPGSQALSHVAVAKEPLLTLSSGSAPPASCGRVFVRQGGCALIGAESSLFAWKAGAVAVP